MWEEVSEQERQKIKAVLNRLLGANFLVREKDRDGYAVIRRHKEAIEQYLQMLDWEIIVDERHECVFVQSPDSSFRRSMDRELSIWLLVLRLIYQEKRKGLTISAFPSTTIHEIRTKYETFRLSWLTKTKLEQAIKLCARYQLAEALDADIRSDDCRIVLYHTWLYVIDSEQLNALQSRIEQYRTGEERGMFDEVAEETAAD
ncbi:DUF4194 domain-containing protein [Paenibacillus sp. YN15]|uniref:DUF4194 domain-containing protein n=1 Tax=Paenibacillus sp. YN15 TaxID=1742774 RepID=UPI000DCE24DD|nr:DUF4194 domain-containing protein [Paenibacillus sp. YN15]RAU92172.1 DUF4194 domain-containing protein [Paenibacillus sp. YN15]